MNTVNSGPSPMPFFETVGAYQRTAALRTAVDLGLFTAIGPGGATASDAAQKCGAAERGVRILCDYLTIVGLLTKQDSLYNLTPDSAMFLDRNSPAYLGGTLHFLLSPTIMEGFQNLTEAVRKGGTALPGQGTVEDAHPVWVDFARAMMPLMMMPAQLMAKSIQCDPHKKMKVLDIAAGHGIFGITLAQQNPNLEVVALDWPDVLAVATENAQRMGVADRHSTLPGSAFDVDFGSGYDLVLITNFLHHFDIPTCESLLKKVYAALVEGGRAATLDFVPNEDRISPPAAAAFSLMMLAGTPSGDAYTFSQYDSMFRNAGFKRSELHALQPSPNQLILSYK